MNSDTTTQKAQATGPVSAEGPSTRFNGSNGSEEPNQTDLGSSDQAQWEFKGVSEDGRDTYVDVLTGRTIVMDDDGNIMPGPITEPGSQTAEPASGPSLSELLQQYAESKPEGQTPAAKEEVNQTMMEVQTGISSGWTPEAEKIYSLMDAGKKQAINSGSNVVSVELGDKPNFNENAARSLIDKAASGGSDSTFTADGKAYNLVVPGGVTVEQREALMKLLAQEPGGTAGPIRLSQLLNQVGVNATVKELTGGELFNRIMGVAEPQKAGQDIQTSGSGNATIAGKNAAGTTVTTLPITIGKAHIPTTLTFDVPAVTLDPSKDGTKTDLQTALGEGQWVFTSEENGNLIFTDVLTGQKKVIQTLGLE